MSEKIRSQYRGEIDRALALVRQLYVANDRLMSRLIDAESKQDCNEIHQILVRLEGRLQGIR